MGKKVLMQGNEACVMGAIAAGMRFFAGYPITPSTEIAEISALPNKDGLLAKVLGTMLAPITSLAVVLGQVVEQKGGSLESAEPAAEEAAE